MKTTRRVADIINSTFPGNYLVHRNLLLRVREDGVHGAPMPLDVMQDLVPWLAAAIDEKAKGSAAWRAFKGVKANRFEVMIPESVVAEIAPTTWWCRSCRRLFNGPLGRTGIRRGRCPSCSSGVVQLNAIFMCPTCHNILPVDAPPCPECASAEHVYLGGAGGRRRDFRWRCRKHSHWEQYVMRLCPSDKARMEMKSPAGGRVYLPAILKDVKPTTVSKTPARILGPLSIQLGRASVRDVAVGRIPVADLTEYQKHREFSPIEPFRTATGNFRCLVHYRETDALTFSSTGPPLDSVMLHSLKHALLNAAPAVTGLTQQEFGASIEESNGSSQLIIYDGVEGGTGGCRLLADRRFERWLDVAQELAECHQIQCEEACRACLFLPARLCAETNRRLNRHSVLKLLADRPPRPA